MSKQHLAILQLLLLPALTAACSGSETIECVADDNCGSGYICVELACVQGARDAGATPDSGFLPDASHSDAAAEVDAGPQSDGAIEPDSGANMDAAVPLDAAVDPDSGVDPDAGMPPDGGHEPDAGTPPDGGTQPDSGPPRDAGTTPDSGPAPLAQDDTFGAVDEESTTQLDVLANDTPAGLAISSVGGPTLGTASINGAQVEFFAGCAAGADSFSYEVRDSAMRTATAQVDLSVQDNLPPEGISAVTAILGSTVDTVQLTFTAPGENGPGSSCPVTSYQVRLADNPQMTGAVTISVPAVAAAGVQEILDLNATWGQAHFVQVAGVDDAGLVGAELLMPASVDLVRTASLVPSAATYDFGPVVEQANASQTWTVQNTSSLMPIEITSVSLAGDTDFGFNPVLPTGVINLSQGQSRSITVRYSPAVPGADAATLSVTTNAPNSGAMLSVSLSGQGVPAVVAANDAFTVEEESTTDLSVLANDSPATGLTLASATAAGSGSALVTAGNTEVRYTVGSGICTSGADTVSYVAQDSLGRTGAANAVITIQDTIAPGPIVTLTPSYAGTTDRVSIAFTAPGENGTGSTCPVSSYELLVADNPAMNNPATTTLASPLSPGTDETAVVALTWGQQHYLQLVALDEGGLRSAPQSPPVAVDARRGVALEPAGTTADIGPVALNGQVDTTFTVRNTSSLAGLSVTSASLTGAPEFTLVGGASGSGATPIGPSGGHDVVLRFAPTARTLYSGTLTIVHNGPGSPLSVALTGTVQPNRKPESPEAYASPRIVPAGATTILTVEVEDLDSSLPGYDDIASVTIDTTALGAAGNASNAMVAGPQTSATGRTYTFGPISTAGLSGGYVFPVRIVDQSGAEHWDAATLAVYTGTARTVGTGGAYPTIQQAIVAAVSGDAILLPAGILAGTGNVNLVFGSNKELVVGHDQGGGRATIDCAGAARAFNLVNTGQTEASVIVGMRLINCSAGALRVLNTQPLIMNVDFGGNTATSDADISGDAVRGVRLTFGAGSPGQQKISNYSDCDYCRVDAPGADTQFYFGRIRYLYTLGGYIYVSTRGLDSNYIRATNPRGLNVTRGADVEVIQSDVALDVDWGLQFDLTQNVRVAGQPLTVSGGIAIQSSNDVSISGIRFTALGFALTRWVGPLSRNITITDCQFPNGPLFSSIAAENLLVTNSRGTRAVDARNSGYPYASMLEMNNGTFVDNVWRDGFAYVDRGSITISDSIISDSVATILELSAATTQSYLPTLDNTMLPVSFGPLSIVDPSAVLNSGNGVACFTGNLNSNQCADPLFVSGPRGDYYLSPTSPALNNGSQSAVAAELNTRTTQANGALDTGTVDLGWHYER